MRASSWSITGLAHRRFGYGGRSLDGGLLFDLLDLPAALARYPCPVRGSYCHDVNCGMGASDLLSLAWSGVIDSVCVAAQFISGAESPHR